MKIGVIGHFGGNQVFLDGQTIKTKEINDYLENYYQIKIDKFDTYKNARNIIKVFYYIIHLLRNNDIIIVILSIRGYKIITPLLMFFNIFYKRRLFDIVVGSRYYIYKNNNFITRLSRKYEKIFVQTNMIKNEYIQRGISNIKILNNFKFLSRGKFHKSKDIIKVCVFSRIIREKGIYEAIEAIIKANRLLKRDVFQLDIYGQIGKDYENEFYDIVHSFPKYIKYKCKVNYNQSVEVLNQYDIMLFLTYYQNEGFPGSIIDAFYSGLAVIATKWNSNFEVLTEGVTGLGVEVHNIDEVVDKLIYYYRNRKILDQTKKNSLNESDKYNPDIVMKSFIETIENNM